jgi:hypothetical protein
MEIIYYNENREVVTADLKRPLRIKLNDDVEMILSINNEGSLEIHKEQFGNGDSVLNIKPAVSNVIKVS